MTLRKNQVGDRQSTPGYRILITSLLALAVVSGSCNWDEDKAKVRKEICDAINDWYMRGLQICNGLPDPLKTQCLIDLSRQNTNFSSAKVQALLAYSTCDETLFKQAIDLLKRGLGGVGALAYGRALGPVVGEGGQFAMLAPAQFDGSSYQLLPGGAIAGYQYADDPIIKTLSLSGAFQLNLTPDGMGGFTGSITNLSISTTIQDTPTSLTLDPNGQPSSVQIRSDGTGIMAFAAILNNDFFGNPPLWVQLPILFPDPRFIIINTNGLVPGEQVFPRVQSGGPDDCNSNGVPDEIDIASGTSMDCNQNGIPDECEIGGEDCNGNNVLDSCDIANGTSQDLDGDGIPDECET